MSKIIERIAIVVSALLFCYLIYFMTCAVKVAFIDIPKEKAANAALIAMHHTAKR